MKTLLLSLFLVLCFSGVFGQAKKFFGVNDGLFGVNSDGSQAEVLVPLYGETPLPPPVTGLLSVYDDDLSEEVIFGVLSQVGEGAIYKLVYDTDIDGLVPVYLHYFYGNDGSSPVGKLSLYNSRLYGVTSSGGTNNNGVIYSINMDGSDFQVEYHFDGTKGSLPYSGLLAFEDEENDIFNFWGTASGGGANGDGAVYTFDPETGTVTLIHSFDAAEANGSATPSGRLTWVNGELWGMASAGGQYGFGTIYAIDPSDNSFVDFHHFNTADGTTPGGHLVYADDPDTGDGFVFGMTSQGGSSNEGTIFSVAADKTGFAVLVDFANNIGAFPMASLSYDWNNQYFLGTTPFSTGTNGGGISFVLDPFQSVGQDLFVVLEEFVADGLAPLVVSNILIRSDGSPLATSALGGDFGAGSVFTVEVGGETVVSFPAWGRNPVGGIAAGGDRLFGVTSTGGEHGAGIVYSTAIDGSDFKVIQNLGATVGSSPKVGLGPANGLLAGTAASGGASGAGTIFTVNPETNTFTKIHDFAGGSEGSGPGNMLEDYYGTLWGAADQGGSNGQGIIYSVSTIGTGFTVIHHFDNSISNEGINCRGKLLQHNSFMYGVTQMGGANGLGTIFKINMSNYEFTKLYDFDATSGGMPEEGLIEFGGMLWGMTFSEGANGLGTIFKIDPADDSFTKTYDFTASSGGNPRGRLMESEGLFFGLTSTEGANNLGTMFALGPDGASLTILHNFTQAEGGSPKNTTLIRVNQSPTVSTIPAMTWYEDTDVVIDLADYFDDVEETAAGLTYAIENESLPAVFSQITFNGAEMTVEMAHNAFNWGTSLIVSAADAEGASVQAEIEVTVRPVADDPSITSASTTYENQTTDGLVITRNAVDGDEIGFIKVTGINNGTLYRSNGTTAINDGEYISIPGGGYNLKFTPTALGEINFKIQAFASSDGEHPGSNEVTATVSVGRADPVITWPSPADIAYGSPLTASHLNASASIEGIFTYDPPAGTVLDYGLGQILAVTFIPDDLAYYNAVTAQQYVNVYRATKMIGVGGANIFTYTRGDYDYEVTTTFSYPNSPVYSNFITGYDDTYWSMSRLGGAAGQGTIFRWLQDGTIDVVHSFDEEDGAEPYGSLLAYDGKYWGTASSGGDNNGGVIFSIEADGSNFTVRHHFGGASNDGETPYTTLTESAGRLWGMSKEGGTEGYGVIFSYDITNNLLEVVYSFMGGDDGSYPYGDLIVSNGKFWGMTNSDGANGYGTIFKLNLDGTGFEVVHSFINSDEGYPLGSFVEFDGLLWAMSGSDDYGSIVTVDPTNDDYQVFHSFDGNDAEYPTGNLAVADGKLWGMSGYAGTLFSIDTEGTLTVVKTFESATGNDPYGSLLHADGLLLGLTSSGSGTYSNGGVFAYDISTTDLETMAFGERGYDPNGELLNMYDKLWGTTQAGGAHGHGTIFTVNPDGTGYTKIHDFDGTNGSKPVRGLLFDNFTQKIWGVTYQGGANDNGTIFSVDRNTLEFEKNHDFDDAGGRYPDGGLISLGGIMYGTATQGGTHGVGVIYKLDPTDNSFTVIKHLAAAESGNPVGRLHKDVLYLYGVATFGGQHSNGAIFKIRPDDLTFEVAHSFSHSTNGSQPKAGLVASNGFLWGTTYQGGGSNQYGTIFRLDPSDDSFETLHTFGNEGPIYPHGRLFESDGRLWGMTTQNGVSNKGALFSIKKDGSNFVQGPAFSENDGGGHRYGSFLTLGTPPEPLAGPEKATNEDYNLNFSFDAFFSDAEDAYNLLNYEVIDNSNPELLSAVVNGSGLSIDPEENQFGSAVLIVRATDSHGQSATNHLTIQVNPVADAPSISNASVTVGQLNESGLVVTKNEADGDEVTHFQIVEIAGGNLYKNDGTTPIINGDFITVAEGTLGLKFSPASASASGSFKAVGALGADQDLVGFTSLAPIITISKQVPSVTWETPQPISYGTPLSDLQLSATASVPGQFNYNRSIGDILDPAVYTINAYFEPDDSENYQNVYGLSVQLTVNKADPDVEWDVASITYGTALSADQYTAMAYGINGSELSGSYYYGFSEGDVLNAGDRVLTLQFEPQDTYRYNVVNVEATITVAKKTAQITSWFNPGPIDYGTAISYDMFEPAVDSPGSVVYDAEEGEVLDAGVQAITSTGFIPDDPDNYSTEINSWTVYLTVNQAEPETDFKTSVDVSYGTPVGEVSFINSTNVEGSFFYSNAGTTIDEDHVFDVGTHTIGFTFAPNGGNYLQVQDSYELNVLPASTDVTWEMPAEITYGTALSQVQLNASASVAGDFSYNPAAGAVLNVGSNTLSVTFTPSSPNYKATSKSVTLVVNKGNLVLAWPNPEAIPYGTPLSGSQLNASANAEGTFVYDKELGDVLEVGEHVLTASFTPANAANFNPVSPVTATLVVTKGVPVVDWDTPEAITYGMAISADQLNATASIPGTFGYSVSDGDILDAGEHLLVATFTPNDQERYAVGLQAQVILTVGRAANIITFEDLPGITFGDGPIDLSAIAGSGLAVEFTSSDEGVISIEGAVATIVGAGTATLSASNGGNANYLAAETVTQEVAVTKKMATIVISNLEQDFDGGPKTPAVVTDPANLNYVILFDGQPNAPSAPGTYEVAVEIEENNYQGSMQGTFVINDSDALAVYEVEEIIAIYPNPVQHDLHVKSMAARRIAIHGLDGKLQIDGMLSTGQAVDVSLLTRGIYLVTLTDEAGVIIRQQKLIKH